MRNRQPPAPSEPATAPSPITATLFAATLALPAVIGLALPAGVDAQEAGPPVPPGAAPSAILERAMESRTRGSNEAAVVVFEIADFQCPYCARFAEAVAPALHERYVDTGQVQWVFVNLPLHTHPLAWHAAEAALCAGAAGDRFWPMHDRLFAEQDTWGDDPDPAALFSGYARDLGVPTAAFDTCTRNDQVAALILQDLGSAISAGITGTPTFLVMKDDQVVERLVGVQSVEEWSNTLDPLLND